MRERVARADHKPQPVLVNVVHTQIRRFRRQRHDANIDRTIFNSLQDLMTEIAIDTDVNLRKPPLELRKNIGQEVQSRGFVRAEQHRPLHHVAAIGHNLHRFVAQAQ